MRVSEQVFVITGGAGGIGLCLVKDLVEEAARVIVLDKNEEALTALQEQYPAIEPHVCELTNFEEVEASLASLDREESIPTVLVNNAGLIHSEPIVSFKPGGDLKHSIKNWHRVIDANLTSIFYVTACVVEKMVQSRTRGLIVNISSISAVGNAGQSAYSAAKAAVNALTVTWSKELGVFGIRSTAIAPGFIDIQSTRSSLSEAQLEELRRKTPLRRLGKPGEVAQALRFLVENDFFNGRVLDLDGGLKL